MSEGARDNDVSRWFAKAGALPTDVEIGLAHLLADGFRYRSGVENVLAVKIVVAELDGSQAVSFHGEIQRTDNQKFLGVFRDAVTNFHVGASGALRVVDDGEA